MMYGEYTDSIPTVDIAHVFLSCFVGTASEIRTPSGLQSNQELALHPVSPARREPGYEANQELDSGKAGNKSTFFVTCRLQDHEESKVPGFTAWADSAAETKAIHHWNGQVAASLPDSLVPGRAWEWDYKLVVDRNLPCVWRVVFSLSVSLAAMRRKLSLNLGRQRHQRRHQKGLWCLCELRSMLWTNV